MIFHLAVLRVIVRTLLRKQVFWWTLLGFIVLGAMNSAGPRSSPFPFIASSICSGFPVAVLYSWRGSRELGELARLLRTTPRGPSAVIPVEIILVLAAAALSCAMLALVPGVRGASPGPPWQLWLVLPLISLIFGSLESVLYRYGLPGLFLLLVVFAASGLAGGVRAPVARLLLVPSYPARIWGWAADSAAASAAPGSPLHPDIYLGAAVLVCAATLPLWILGKGSPRGS